MRCSYSFFLALLLMVSIVTPSNSQTDSLQVKIINTPEPVGSFRFVVRDSNNLILRVMDKDGNAFKQLHPDQVQIFNQTELAKIIKVTPLEATVMTSLNVVLAMDNSASMQPSVKELLASVNLLLNALRYKSRISVVLFDESAAGNSRFIGRIDDQPVNVKFSDFYDNVQQVMDFVKWNYGARGLTLRTYLHDMILVGLQQMKSLPKNLLRVMVVLSDGRDMGSRFGLDRVLREAAAAGVTIYCIDYSESKELNEALTRVAQATPQGKVFRAAKAADLMPVFDALSKEIITEFQVNFRFPVPPSGNIEFNGDSLLITTRKITDEFPMLSYVFFDSNSVEIHERYHLFSSPDEARTFDESQLQKPLEKYYHILNVIGQRARNDSTAKLTITGCNMNFGAEKNNLLLSKQRAEAVSRYLQDIWGLAPDRITVRAVNLPEKKSSITTPEGQAENRRVEISSDHYYILRPIRSEITEFIYQPEIAQFTPKISAPEGLKQWEFYAFDQSVPLIRMTFDMPKSSINWNWINDQGEKISGLSRIAYGIKITDQDGRVYESELQQLPINQIVEATNVAETSQDTVFEKFSLVLFDFNSSHLSENNQYLMQRVLGRYQEHPEAIIKVYGYCDDIGSEEYNLKLSTERAKMTYNILRQMRIPADRLSYLGYGEINPLFSNASPEGRFLNRTVQIHISYPRTSESDR